MVVGCHRLPFLSQQLNRWQVQFKSSRVLLSTARRCPLSPSPLTEVLHSPPCRVIAPHILAHIQVVVLPRLSNPTAPHLPYKEAHPSLNTQWPYRVTQGIKRPFSCRDKPNLSADWPKLETLRKLLGVDEPKSFCSWSQVRTRQSNSRRGRYNN